MGRVELRLSPRDVIVAVFVNTHVRPPPESFIQRSASGVLYLGKCREFFSVIGYLTAGSAMRSPVMPGPQASALRRQPDDVPRPLAAGAAANGDFLDREAGVAQSSREGDIGGGRPDGEHAAGPKRRLRRFQPVARIETVVALAGEAVRPVVDIEQDRVPIFAGLGDRDRDVGLDQANAGV